MRAPSKAATILALAAGLTLATSSLAASAGNAADNDPNAPPGKGTFGAPPDAPGAPGAPTPPAPKTRRHVARAHPHPASGRSAAVSGTFCDTPTRTCLLGTATPVGGPCACGLTGGASVGGRVAP